MCPENVVFGRARGAGELGLSLKAPSAHPMVDAVLSLITLCVLFLCPQLITAAGKLLDRVSRVPGLAPMLVGWGSMI